MKRGIRAIQGLSIAVILMGWLAIGVNPASAFGVAVDPCILCWTQCPDDLEGFCHDQECPAGPGTVCEFRQCKGVSGTWYSYRIKCLNGEVEN